MDADDSYWNEWDWEPNDWSPSTQVYWQDDPSWWSYWPEEETEDVQPDEQSADPEEVQLVEAFNIASEAIRALKDAREAVRRIRQSRVTMLLSRTVARAWFQWWHRASPCLIDAGVIGWDRRAPVEVCRGLVKVHGFGASSYHWRYQVNGKIPSTFRDDPAPFLEGVATLAEQGYRVYSMCLLGYGWSDRAVLQYSGEVWAAQINDFLKQVAGDRPTVLVGNSIGAFATLLAASTAPSTACAGLVLLNAAGRFEERQPGEAPARKQAGDLVAEAEEQAEPGPIQWALQQVRRALASWAFYTTKLRIEPILQWVYVNEQQVDADLVTSIRMPAEHPQALDAFAEVIQAGRRTQVSVFEALDALPSSLPVLLIWGMQDPWPARDVFGVFGRAIIESPLDLKSSASCAGHRPISP
ncbi:unnamed protein product [Cladocopium goreaui]|uniref:Pheophytinase, chloroplastic (Pheophyti n pheophorbide hydrolase) (Protein CO-REGULATED WITH NYE1) n=1 Tax=Cladocopium goreaui TaxID=2562237 RepID=A0A9P1GRS8_9DINO|nr:unnamed protein product [Cladocopium goreaui]